MEFPRIRTHPHNNKKTSYEEKKTYIGNKSKQKNLKKKSNQKHLSFLSTGKKKTDKRNVQRTRFPTKWIMTVEKKFFEKVFLLHAQLSGPNYNPRIS